jgi:hypothetical protein
VVENSRPEALSFGNIGIDIRACRCGGNRTVVVSEEWSPLDLYKIKEVGLSTSGDKTDIIGNNT